MWAGDMRSMDESLEKFVYRAERIRQADGTISVERAPFIQQKITEQNNLKKCREWKLFPSPLELPEDYWEFQMNSPGTYRKTSFVQLDKKCWLTEVDNVSRWEKNNCVGIQFITIKKNIRNLFFIAQFENDSKQLRKFLFFYSVYSQTDYLFCCFFPHLNSIWILN